MAEPTKDARKMFEAAFFQEVLDPGDPRILDLKQASSKASKDIWDLSSSEKEEEKKIEITVDGNCVAVNVDCKAVFDPYHPELIKGYIDNEELIMKNTGDIIEFKIPGWLNDKRLAFVKAGNQETTIQSIAPNMDYLDSVAATGGVFHLTAEYR